MANQHEGVVEESAFSYKTDEDRKQDQEEQIRKEEDRLLKHLKGKEAKVDVKKVEEEDEEQKKREEAARIKLEARLKAAEEKKAQQQREHEEARQKRLADEEDEKKKRAAAAKLMGALANKLP